MATKKVAKTKVKAKTKAKAKKSKLGWHILRGKFPVGNVGEGRGVIANTNKDAPKDLVTLKLGGRISVCSHGYHASPLIEHAWRYINPTVGDFICRVRSSGRIDSGSYTNKWASSERTILWRLQVTNELLDALERAKGRYVVPPRKPMLDAYARYGLTSHAKSGCRCNECKRLKKRVVRDKKRISNEKKKYEKAMVQWKADMAAFDKKEKENSLEKIVTDAYVKDGKKVY